MEVITTVVPPGGVRAPGETKQDRLGRSKSERRKRRGDEAKAGAPYEEGRAGGARDRGARGPGAGPGRGAGEGAGDRRRLRRRDDAPRPLPWRAELPLHARLRPRRPLSFWLRRARLPSRRGSGRI